MLQRVSVLRRMITLQAAVSLIVRYQVFKAVGVNTISKALERLTLIMKAAANRSDC